MKIIHTTVSRGQLWASTIIIKKEADTFRKILSTLNQKRLSLPLLPLGIPLAPSPISASFSLLKCRILWTSVSGRGAERKNYLIDINMSRWRSDRRSKRIPADGTFFFINGRSMSHSYDGKASSPNSRWALGACRSIAASPTPLYF